MSIDVTGRGGEFRIVGFRRKVLIKVEGDAVLQLRFEERRR